MNPNRQLGWAGPSAGYAPPTHTSTLHSRAPFWRPIFAYVLVIAVVSLGTITAVNTMAAKQVAYQPPTSSPKAPVQTTNSSPPPTTAQPALVTKTPDPSPGLQTILNNWVNSHSDHQWAVSVQTLGTDTISASVKSSTYFKTASIYKLFLLYPLFQKYSLDSLSSRNLNVEGRGSMTLKQCVDLMIKESDNPCGQAVGNYLGWGSATSLLKKIGLASTNLNNTNGMTTTTADTTSFLEKLHWGQLFDDQDQQYVLTLMQQQKFRQGIPAGCTGCTVADKIGELSDARHDVGIVQYADKAYALSIFTNGASYSQIAQLTSQIHAYMTAH